MPAPDNRGEKSPFADDGIPVLTEVVDPSLVPLPQIDPESLAMLEPEGPPSLAMFPELEPDAPPPATAIAQPIVAAIPAPAEHGADGGIAPITGNPGEASLSFRPFAAAGQATAPEPFDTAASPWPAAQTPANAADGTSIEGRAAAHAPAFEPLQSVDAVWRPTPEAPGAAAQGAPRLATVPSDLLESAMPPAAQPAAITISAPAENAKDVETRIFESIAARLDQLLEARLEAIVPVVVEAALAGVQAGMAASVRQAFPAFKVLSRSSTVRSRRRPSCGRMPPPRA